MKHKHAEVLIAIAEGRLVEFESNSKGWVVATPVDSITNPINHDYLEWRVKPVPEIRYEWLVRECYSTGGQGGNHYAVFYDPTLCPNWDICITYEDDNPIKVEARQ